MGGNHKVGDGKLTQFWNDVWAQSTPLRVCFPKLFAICEDKNISVARYAELGVTEPPQKMRGLSLKIISEDSR
jgi:hypothetical protein